MGIGFLAFQLFGSSCQDILLPSCSLDFGTLQWVPPTTQLGRTTGGRITFLHLVLEAFRTWVTSICNKCRRPPLPLLLKVISVSSHDGEHPHIC